MVCLRFWPSFAALRYTIALTLALLVSPSLAFAAAPPQPALPSDASSIFRIPPLKTDAERLSYLLYIRSQVPALFEDAANYDIDLMELISSQEKLQNALYKIERYQELIKNGGPLKTISIQVTDPAARVKVREPLPETILQEWRNELKETYKVVIANKKPGTQTSSTATLEDVDVYLQGLRSRIQNWKNPSALLAGLQSAQLKPEQRQEIKAIKGIEDKLQYLREHVNPDEILSNSFRGEAFGLGKDATVGDAFNLLEEGIRNQPAYEETIAAYDRALAFAAVVQRQGAFQEYMLHHLTEADLNFMMDKKDTLTPLLKKFHESAPPKQLEEIVDRAYRRFAYYSNQAVQKESALQSAKLVQVPAPIADFRGCTGGDCSSQYSFPYPNDPHEPVFFVNNADGKLVGYVSTTAVLDEEGKLSLYVNTISGNSISGNETISILNGLSKRMKELGVEQIVLPNASNLHSLINSPSIRKAFELMSQGGREVKISYQDSEIRKTIEEFASPYNSGHYDHMENNQTAIVMKARPEISEALEVQVESKVLFDPFVYQKPTDQEIFEFALDLQHSERSIQMSRVLAIGSHTPEDLKSFTNLMQNEKGMNVEKFEKSLADWLTAHKMDPSLLNKKGYLSYVGRLRAPDALSAENFKTTSKLVLEEFKAELDGKAISPEGSDFIQDHMDQLFKNAGFKNALETMVEEAKKTGNLVDMASAAYRLKSLITYRSKAVSPWLNELLDVMAEKIVEPVKAADKHAAIDLFRKLLTEQYQIPEPTLIKLVRGFDPLNPSAASAGADFHNSSFNLLITDLSKSEANLSETVVREFNSSLTNTGHYVRDAAQNAIRTYATKTHLAPPGTLDTLRKALTNSDESIVGDAYHCLADLARSNVAIPENIALKALRDEKGLRLLAALVSNGNAVPPYLSNALPQVLDRLKETNRWNRNVAIYAVKGNQDIPKPVYELIFEYLKDDHPDTRSAAQTFMVELHGENDLPEAVLQSKISTMNFGSDDLRLNSHDFVRKQLNKIADPSPVVEAAVRTATEAKETRALNMGGKTLAEIAKQRVYLSPEILQHFKATSIVRTEYLDGVLAATQPPEYMAKLPWISETLANVSAAPQDVLKAEMEVRDAAMARYSIPDSILVQIAKRLGSTDPGIRTMALKVFSNLGSNQVRIPPAAIKEIEPLLRAPESETRLLAQETLERLTKDTRFPPTLSEDAYVAIIENLGRGHAYDGEKQTLYELRMSSNHFLFHWSSHGPALPERAIEKLRAYRDVRRYGSDLAKIEERAKAHALELQYSGNPCEKGYRAISRRAHGL